MGLNRVIPFTNDEVYCRCLRCGESFFYTLDDVNSGVICFECNRTYCDSCWAEKGYRCDAYNCKKKLLKSTSLTSLFDDIRP